MGVSSVGVLRSIGLRAAPSIVYYAVVEGRSASDQAELLTVGSLPVPVALELPDRLSFVRTTILDIIIEFDARRAGIRLIEYTAQTKPVERLNLEGVLQELLSSSEIEGYFAGAIARIGGLLGEPDKTRVKRYFEGEAFMGVEGWDGRAVEQREAIVTAVAALAIGATR
jgi:hypothetical protein